ncbi:MAG TPA: amidohydrolase/deacetylase family metallohydrolase [Chloroflexota bacterium]|nr:amidohydrolase/deacetylase family metallohydrolase [Chloroflexota bacterium]
MFDLIVRGGRVIDPSQDLDGVRDVGVIGPRIAEIGPDLARQGVRGAVVDASGLVVTPGWVDLHTHVYWGVAPLGVDADAHCLRRGVTTAVDAGSAGASTFPGFKRYVIDVSLTRVVAMLHLSAIGMARDDSFGAEAIGELEDIRWANVERALAVARAYADTITGIKLRISEELVGPDAEHTREVLRRARQVADAIGKPVMVHAGHTAIPLDEILGNLVRGDVVTHVYHARTEGVLDEHARVRASVRAAVDRGVHFDVGHGAGSFDWTVARAGLAQGLLPTTISSDIHAWNIAGPVYDLATTASKFLHLGLTLPAVLERVTTTPAACIGRADELGTLSPGAAADITLLRLTDGEFRFRDSAGVEELAGTRLDPVAVIRGGRHYACTPGLPA